MQLPGDRFSFSVKPERIEKKRKKRRLVFVLGALVAAATLGFFIISGRAGLPFTADGAGQPAETEEKSLEELWQQRTYATLNERCEQELEENPLSAECLLYNGFSYFYRGANQYTPEDQLPLFDKAVLNLRKLLVLDSPPEEGKIHYVLGKTYYHKGRFYLDLAVHHLERSVELGYVAEDTYRYLGLVFGELSDYEKSIEYFLEAAERSPDAILYMTIGQTYYKMGQSENALEFLTRSVQATDKLAIEQRARFILGKIHLDKGQLEKARDQFEVILSNDPESADAHYHLGEIFERQGDNVKARAEWRKALDIEPSHYGALLKLY